MGIKDRIEKLEKYSLSDESLIETTFYEFCDASGEKRLFQGDKPVSQEDFHRAQQQAEQQGYKVLILSFPPSTEIIPGRMGGHGLARAYRQRDKIEY